jgi:acyl carrier protein
MNEPHDIVLHHLSKCLRLSGAKPNGIDFDADLKRHYGLTSLNLMLLITSVCDDAAIELSNFTEDDIARLRTPRDIVAMLASARRRQP